MGIGSIHGRRDVATHQRRPLVHGIRGCRDISSSKASRCRVGLCRAGPCRPYLDFLPSKPRRTRSSLRAPLVITSILAISKPHLLRRKAVLSLSRALHLSENWLKNLQRNAAKLSALTWDGHLYICMISMRATASRKSATPFFVCHPSLGAPYRAPQGHEGAGKGKVAYVRTKGACRGKKWT